jgi:hypothetical protein
MTLKLPVQIRPRMAQMRLGLRVTVAVMAAFVAADNFEWGRRLRHPFRAPARGLPLGSVSIFLWTL